MICEHLIELEQAIIEAGFRETFRGRAWSHNCREWVYFDCFLPLETIRQKFNLAPCVQVHQHLGTHDGQEAGFVCLEHHDGVMGYHPQAGVSAPTFNPYDGALPQFHRMKAITSCIGDLFRTYALWPVSPPSHNEHGQETGSSNPVSPMFFIFPALP